MTKSLKEVAGDGLAQLILQNRERKIKVTPGFDGQYGVAIIAGKEIIPEDSEKKETTVKTKNKQKSLNEF